MKQLKLFIIILIIGITSTSCFKDDDDSAATKTEINDFIWRGMNLAYLYQNEVPNLADNRFPNSNEYYSYLNSFTTPEDLFENLIYNRSSIDKFSWIVSDYFQLEQLFHGTTTTSGAQYDFLTFSNDGNDLFGIVKLVLPNSPAEQANLKRGDIFYAINGEKLTTSNLSKLLRQPTYTLNLGFYNDNGSLDKTDDYIQPLGNSITINKTAYTENPIYKSKIITTNNSKIGYLMYNVFIGGSESQLNNVLEDFKLNNIQHLILDLRYNPGGNINTATYLASMITGQFSNDIFMKLVYNNKLQYANTNYSFKSHLNEKPITQLGLNKIYVLTTHNSASASETLINCLKPYIDVIQIGDKTTGKTQASVTIYDSPDFSRNKVNPTHTYAMQPLVANAVNKYDNTVPSDGLTPTITYREDPQNYGIIGDENEPLLALALADISGLAAKKETIKSNTNLAIIKINYNENSLKGGLRIN